MVKKGDIMHRAILLVIMIGLFLPSYAQEGQGVIRQAVISDLDTDITSFNPLLCDDRACRIVTDLLFPTLLAPDYETGWYAAGTAENNAMATRWTISEDNLIYTFTLRDDAVWSDGKPITAYDYFYSYLARLELRGSRNLAPIVEEYISGVVPLNDSELAIIVNDPYCDALSLMDFVFLPSHVFDADFAATARDFFAGNDGVQAMWSAWHETFEYDFDFMHTHPFNEEPLVTGDSFEFVEWHQREHIRLKNGDLAYELIPVSDETTAIDLFFDGETNIVTQVPTERIADFANYPDVEIYETDTASWDYIAFNLADPTEPKSGFDEDGNPQEQGEHPILSNINVRQAIQLGIDREVLIDVALHGQGKAIPSVSNPISWEYNDTLSPIGFDADEAEHLLDEAGWVRVGNRSIRECVNCGSVDDGTTLSLSLGHLSFGHYPVAAILIQQQLRRIGFDIYTYSISFTDIFNQQFDLVLSSWGNGYPSDPLTHLILTPEADNLELDFYNWNFTSYNNPEVTDLLHQARTVPGCDLDTRKALYGEVQAIVQQDLPFAFLYVETEVNATHASVQNIVPQTYNFFWNLDEWRVFDAP